jgi:hypothetical protein
VRGLWVLSPSCQPRLIAEDKSLQKMGCNENTDRPFKVMELQGLPFVTFPVLGNYCLGNSLFFTPERRVLDLQQEPLYCKIPSCLGLEVGWIWPGSDPSLTRGCNFLFHGGWNQPRVITRITTQGVGQCKQVSHLSNLQLSCSRPKKWVLCCLSVLYEWV